MRLRWSIFLLIPLLGCGDTTAPSSGFTVSQNAVVNVSDNTFDPSDITIRAGEHVTWNWLGTAMHSVHMFGAPTATASLRNTGLFDMQFNTPGTYLYYCDAHGAQSGLTVTGMHGKITVSQ